MFPLQLDLALIGAVAGDGVFQLFDQRGRLIHGHFDASKILRLIVFETPLTGLLIDDKLPDFRVAEKDVERVIALRDGKAGDIQIGIRVQDGCRIGAGPPYRIVLLFGEKSTRAEDLAPRTEGASYLMVRVLPPIVPVACFDGLGFWAPANDANRQTVQIVAKSCFIIDRAKCRAGLLYRRHAGHGQDLTSQFNHIDGLSEIAVHAGRQAEFPVAVHRIRGHGDNGRTAVAVTFLNADRHGGFEPVHLGHLHIH